MYGMKTGDVNVISTQLNMLMPTGLITVGIVRRPRAAPHSIAYNGPKLQSTNFVDMTL